MVDIIDFFCPDVPLLCPPCAQGRHGAECFQEELNRGAVDFLDFGHYCDCPCDKGGDA